MPPNLVHMLALGGGSICLGGVLDWVTRYRRRRTQHSRSSIKTLRLQRDTIPHVYADDDILSFAYALEEHLPPDTCQTYDCLLQKMETLMQLKHSIVQCKNPQLMNAVEAYEHFKYIQHLYTDLRERLQMSHQEPLITVRSLQYLKHIFSIIQSYQQVIVSLTRDENINIPYSARDIGSIS